MNYRNLSLILTRAATGLNRFGVTAGSAAESRSYYTTTLTRKTLYSKICPLGDPGITVVPELDKWVENGRKVSVAELQRIIHDLRKRKRFSQALQVSEWMNEKGICIFSTAEHAVQLDLIGKVHGYEAAERYFRKLKDEDKNAKTYGALLNCYVRQNLVDKALFHFQKMKEMGFASPLAYNSIMRLYNNLEQHAKVPDVLVEMKSNNVSPDNYSYRICITSFGEKGDIEGMKQVLEEMEGQDHIVMDWTTYAVVANFYIKAGQTEQAISALQKSEKRLALENGDGVAYNHLISLYAKIGNLSEVLRLWDSEKQACKRYLNRDYMNMLKSLVRLGALEEAEKVLKDWDSSSNYYDARLPQLVIDGYSEKGLVEKAKSLIDDLQKKGKEGPQTV
ncbi:unnamed protein product [Rhodiola kirilowii]